MPDYEANIPVENVDLNNAPVADAQGGSDAAVEEVVISVEEPSVPPASGSDKSVDAANAAQPPADGAQYKSQKDIDAAFGKRLAKEREKFERSPEWQLGSLYLDERAQRDGVSREEAYRRIQQERIDAKADAYAKDPKQFYRDLLQGTASNPQRQPAFQPPAQEDPEAQAKRVGEEIANMYKAGTLPAGFDFKKLDQDTYNNIVEYGGPAAMRIWAAEHGPAQELSRRQSGPAPMRPTSSNQRNAPPDYQAMSSEDYYKKKAEIRKAMLDGKRVRLS